MNNKVWMKHFETGEVREVEMGDELFRLMIKGWNQCEAPAAPQVTEEKE